MSDVSKPYGGDCINITLLYLKKLKEIFTNTIVSEIEMSFGFVHRCVSMYFDHKTHI